MIQFEPIIQSLPIETFFSIIVLDPIIDFFPILTLLPTKTFFPNFINLNCFLFGCLRERSGKSIEAKGI